MSRELPGPREALLEAAACVPPESRVRGTSAVPGAPDNHHERVGSMKRRRRYCLTPGCSEMVERGRCAKHKRERQRAYDSARDSGWKRSRRSFYWSRRWREFRAAYVRKYPLCVRCLAEGRTSPTEHVHHVVPREEAPGRSFDDSNLEALCASCHNIVEPRGGGP
jgi:5-methylcytosine-specific restriction endonuclease McrA